LANLSKSLKPAPEPGQQLRQAREKLRLKYRDVEEASRRIATKNRNDEFLVGLSRLADIENRGTVPSLYRLYSLCAIYGLDWGQVLMWYGVNLDELPGDSARSIHAQSRLLGVSTRQTESVDVPELGVAVELRKTSYISREILRWGKLPAVLLKSLDLQKQKYGFLGTEDWSMYPILAPGSFLHIDDTKTKIIQESWTHEIERPIYFLEHRQGFRCGWCTQADGLLIVQPHWSSQRPPEIFHYPADIEVVGQVVGVAMKLGSGKRRHTRFSAGPG
jgi:transcriptional regulator with XRE-family HTH domain